MPASGTKYSKSWEDLPQCKGWLSCLVLKDGTEKAKCSLCNSEFLVSYRGFKDVEAHINSKKHAKFVEAKFSTKSVDTFMGKFYFTTNFTIYCNNRTHCLLLLLLLLL